MHVNVTKLTKFLDIARSIEIIKNLIKFPKESTFTYKVDNLTAVGKFKTNVNLLQTIEKCNIGLTRFNPEKFPGLFIKSGKGTLILFSTGSFVIVGGKNLNGMNELVFDVKQCVCT